MLILANFGITGVIALKITEHTHMSYLLFIYFFCVMTSGLCKEQSETQFFGDISVLHSIDWLMGCVC